MSHLKCLDYLGDIFRRKLKVLVCVRKSVSLRWFGLVWFLGPENSILNLRFDTAIVDTKMNDYNRWHGTLHHYSQISEKSA